MTSTSCPICLEWHRPIKILDCGHSFCYRCIRNADRDYSDPTSMVAMLRCPVCREQNAVPVHGVRNLPTNIAFEKALLGKGMIDEDEDGKSKNSSLPVIDFVQLSQGPTWNSYRYVNRARTRSGPALAPASQFVSSDAEEQEQSEDAVVAIVLAERSRYVEHLSSQSFYYNSPDTSLFVRTIDELDLDDWHEDEHRFSSLMPIDDVVWDEDQLPSPMPFDEDQSIRGNSWHPRINLDGNVDSEISLPSIGENGIPRVDELSEFEIDALSVSVADSLAKSTASENELPQ